MKKNCIILTLCLQMCMITNMHAIDVFDMTIYRVYKIYTGSTTKADAFYMTRSTRNTVKKDGKTYCVYEISDVPSNCNNIQRTLLYRQEGQRIYNYDETRQEEVLLFDFSLNEGDVFITPQGTRMEVVEVSDCTEYMNDWLVWNYLGRKLRLRNCDNAVVEDIWIEGIGSLHTGILSPEFIPNAEECSLDFCDMGRWAAIFPHNTPYYKSVLSVPYEMLNHEQPEYQNYSFSGDTLIISGCAVLNSYNFVTSCFIHENIIELDTYTVLIYGEDLLDGRALRSYEAKIPGFQAGEYTIMASGRKLATVVCVTTSLNTFEISAKHPYQFHDLLGRPINTLQKGINIINGNKIMVK